MTGSSSQPFIPAGSKHSHHASAKISKKTSSAAGPATEEDDRRKTVDRGGDRLLGSTRDYLAASGSRRSEAKVPVQPESPSFQDRPARDLKMFPPNLSNEALYFPLSRPSRYVSLSSPLSTSSHASHSGGSASSSRCSLDQSNLLQAQDRLQLVTCEAENMAAKLKSVKEVLDTASDDLSQLRSLVSRLERLGGSKNVENAELKCTLLKTYIEGLNESVKTMPHYYPSKTMFVEAIMALKEALSCHDYVSVVDGEKSQLLRDHERLRNEMRLIVDENEKLKRRHHKDKKIISELMERVGPSARFSHIHSGVIDSSSPKVNATSAPHIVSGLTGSLGLSGHHSPSLQGGTHRSGHTLQQNTVSASHREEDIKLIEMLREVKVLLQQGGGDADLVSKRCQDENAGSNNNNGTSSASNKNNNNNRDYDTILRRLREAMGSDRLSGGQRHSQDDDVIAMDSYFRIFEKNISLIEQELNSSSNTSSNSPNKSGAHNAISKQL